MKSFACYCQKCRAANVPGEEMCVNCGTPLMLVVVPASSKNETLWSDTLPPEHLLERISILELRLMQVTDRLSQILDLMLKQSRTVQSEHLLVETLLDTLTAAGVIEGGTISHIWQEKKRGEEAKASVEVRQMETLDRILAATNGTKIDLFTNLVKEGFRQIQRGDEKHGVRTLERAAAIEPANFPLAAFIGEYFFQNDKPILARDYFAKAHLAAPLERRISLLLGVILADEVRIETAKKLLEPLGDETNFAANFVLGLLYAAEIHFGLALAAFKRALKALPCAETYYLVGSTYAALGREKMAEKHLKKAVELDADFADAWFMLGTIYARAGNEPAAKEALNQTRTARDSSAFSQAILRNPKKHGEIENINLLFAHLADKKKNLVGGTSPRLVKLLRDELKKI